MHDEGRQLGASEDIIYFQFSIWDAQIVAYERWRYVGELVFQFSIWDADSCYAKRERTYITFQFSIWDALSFSCLSASWCVRPFNSLFEMLVLAHGVVADIVFKTLSILYLRCRYERWDGRAGERRYVRLSILYLRCGFRGMWSFSASSFTFNSLFEMRHLRWFSPLQASLVLAFNSLFEMPRGPRACLVIYCIVDLSILYLRCQNSTDKVADIFIATLSILYLRCIKRLW